MKVKKGFEMQNVCGEHILVPAGVENVDFSRIISLNPTAAFLWEHASRLETFTVDNLAEALLEEYDVEEGIAREDCRLIAERWSEMGLIEE
ncbi:MAG: PqqD family protein [Bacteroidaceae bacterium]|nr:PqqD family protein [Bacteroidaceae bacterium]